MPVRSKRSYFGRAVSFVVDESPLWVWILSFLGMVVLFAILYALLSPIGHGIKGAHDISFARGLYFSVVTVSSLGYGDLQPDGIAKFLAGAEVLLGLGFIGVMIAKLTSRPLSYLVSRLFVSETKRQLQHFKALFDSRRSDLDALLRVVSKVYQQTPGGAGGADENSGELDGFGSALGRLYGASAELHDYLQDEGLHRSYFVLAPTNSLVQVAEAVEKAYFYLGQIIVSLPGSSNSSILDHVLTYGNRRTIDDLIRVQLATCEMIEAATRTDDQVRVAYRRIDSLCRRISELLLRVREQPDQLIQAL